MSKEIQWVKNKRFEFIEESLYWRSTIRRKDIIENFNISIAQATSDLSEYKKLHSENLNYNRSDKCYKVSDNFTPYYAKLISNNYFDSITVREANTSYYTPEIAVVPKVNREVKPEILQNIVHCINNNCSIKIKYISMNSSKETWRLVTPHSFADDGSRKHIRAFCHNNKDFRDFQIGRILETGELNDFQVDKSLDLLWSSKLIIQITPNPKLTLEQQKGIEFEYNMVNGLRDIEIKPAFFRYLCNNLDIEKRKSREPYLVINNMKEIANKIKLLEELTKNNTKNINIT
ncbi:WYL domain-containing protein [Thiospirochaeta perfilievii]|uniref:WYL domain-containing protein n=1 Tax=Thiospirochaeta perfilievii TaxID=252967 RepID=A0A5C1Q7G5_9SPIO|nr:WYL domain-containing protein [Thiospirochaeta perfilievii]QEN03371.1 WYL domain-containing protein [Thiospirochaeta perfilievii]